MAQRTLLNETTEIPSERTAGEISSLLVRCGAKQITIEYADGKAVGMRFTLEVNGGQHHFKMPVRVAGVAKIFKDRRVKSHGYYGAEKFANNDAAQAERVAWRQLYRWIQAQLAMIESGSAVAREVFLPYLWDGEKTLFEAVETTRYKALPAPGSQYGRHQ